VAHLRCHERSGVRGLAEATQPCAARHSAPEQARDRVAKLCAIRRLIAPLRLLLASNSKRNLGRTPDAQVLGLFFSKSGNRELSIQWHQTEEVQMSVMTAAGRSTRRNQLRGRVTRVSSGYATTEVSIDARGEEFVAHVSRERAERLHINKGDLIKVFVNPIEIVLARHASDLEELITFNHLHGTIGGVFVGALMAEVTIDVHGDKIVAVVPVDSFDRLKLSLDDEVILLVSADEVLLGK
jgi:molybdate transport system regulatory protein